MGSIRLREAAAKYGVPPSTISHWAESGLIRVLQRPEKRGQAMLLVEADVKAAAANYTPGPGRGKRKKLFEAIAAA